MKKVTKAVEQLELKDIEINNKKSLRDDLKELHKTTSRPKVNQKYNNKNNKNNDSTSNEKIILKSGVYTKDKDINNSIKFKDEKIKLKKEIKKIKLNEIVNNERKNENEIPPYNLRRIYVDLNEENFINEYSNDILSNQKMIYNDNSIRTCQYTIITFFPLALLNQFKSAFNWFFLIYSI